MTKLIIIGGFLGSGKTTVILELAKRFLSLGQKVGIVTNDQGSELVDTEFLRANGLSVLEVTGGCFCCNFDEFTRKVEELAKSEMPDVILAEPVGSCTDLIATIFKPIKYGKALGKQFSMSPLTVLADPKRVKRLMLDKHIFNNEVNYLFKKQLEEANIIAVNKIDTIDEESLNSIYDFLGKRFPGADILKVSAQNNTNMELLLNELINKYEEPDILQEINYDIYAAAEASLGWLNAYMSIKSNKIFDANKLCSDFVELLKQDFAKGSNDIAHLKIYAVSNAESAKLSLTDLGEQGEFTGKFSSKTSNINLILNARIHIEPWKLKKIVENKISKLLIDNEAVCENLKIECFAPSYPKPMYRLT